MPRTSKRGVPLFVQILIALGVGILVGLFFGEKAAGLKLIGRVYVGLIQMSILPYMVVSLILGIGSLNYAKAKDLAIRGGLVLGGVWGLVVLVVYGLRFAFPEVEAGSFYSPDLVDRSEVDFVDLYIPANPFGALARAVVPAAVVFCVSFGVALIGVANKERVLDVLHIVADTLTRIAMMVVKTTPIGVFGISAHAAGTLTIDQLGRLQAYVLLYIVVALLLTFWILPGLVAALTPFSYRDILSTSRDALAAGFVTANIYITVPILVEGMKGLFENHNLRDEDTDNYAEALIPTAINFPQANNLLSIVFVVFAAWFVGKGIDTSAFPGVALLGICTMFGGEDLALPYLLDHMQLHADLYQLYVVTAVTNNWFAKLLGVMSLFSISLLTACTAMRLVRVNVPKVLKFSLVSAGLLLVVVVGVRQSVSMMLSEDSILAQALLETSLEGSDPITEQAITARQELPEDPTTPPPSPLQDIFERGTLRVGFFPENLPFSFYNNKRELIGFDVELLTVLAHELNVRLEFVPWEYESLFEDLADHKFDVVIGGMIVNPERLAKASFSEPYLNITTSVVVEDFQRHAFETWSDIDRAAGVRLGVVGEKRAAHMRAMLPNTEVVTLSSYEDFFEQNTSNATAMVISAEAGSAYTTVYPSHSVVVPEPHMKAHMALFFPPGESDFRDLVDDWLRLKKTSGLVDRLYNKWILGKTEERYRVRWSIGRDVLGLWE